MAQARPLSSMMILPRRHRARRCNVSATVLRVETPPCLSAMMPMAASTAPPPARSSPSAIVRRFMSSSSTSGGGGGGANKPPMFNTPHPENCDVVRGPSLLRTSVARPQPSLLFLPGLRSLPFWTQPLTPDRGSTRPAQSANRIAYRDPMVTQVVTLLEDSYAAIKKEYLEVAHNVFSDYQSDTEHHTLHQGRWDWHSYMSKGKLQPTFATHFVETSAVLQRLRDAGWLFEGVPFGYAFFSTLHPWSRIAPHSSPMNFRLRVHLPLVVPDWSFLASGTEATLRADWIRNSGGNDDDDVDRGVGIQVGPIRQEWVEGQAMVLDDSYVHRVWNESDRSRVILLVDVWHPDVAARERTEIVQLFQHAADQGWWSPSSAPPAW